MVSAAVLNEEPVFSYSHKVSAKVVILLPSWDTLWVLQRIKKSLNSYNSFFCIFFITLLLFVFNISQNRSKVWGNQHNVFPPCSLLRLCMELMQYKVSFYFLSFFYFFMNSSLLHYKRFITLWQIIFCCHQDLISQIRDTIKISFLFLPHKANQHASQFIPKPIMFIINVLVQL